MEKAAPPQVHPTPPHIDEHQLYSSRELYTDNLVLAAKLCRSPIQLSLPIDYVSRSYATTYTTALPSVQPLAAYKHNMTKKLQVTPLGPTIGAEVKGVDFSKPIPDDVSDELKAALHVYGVLVLRSTNVTDDSMIALGRKWGPLDNITAHKKAGRKMRLEQDEIFDVSNIDPDDNLITAADPLRLSSARGNALWHADGAYNPRRSGISIIRAVELPPPGTGGETEFLDSRTAYEDLSPEKKNEIHDYVGMNTLLWNRVVANPDMETFTSLDFTKVTMSKHRIAQIHEPTGRGNLYIGSYNHHIEGLPWDEGRRITDELFEHVKQDKYKFTVHWENPGDMAFWDNTAVLHRATTGAYSGKYRRDMRRISTFDDSKWAYGENDPENSKQVGLT